MLLLCIQIDGYQLILHFIVKIQCGLEDLANHGLPLENEDPNLTQLRENFA
jgi:hypothetical protein